MLALVAAALAAFLVAPAQERPDKQLVVSISGPDLKGGIVSEITWDGGLLMMQGVFAEPGGELKAHYLVTAADGITLEKREAQTEASAKYWQMKSGRVSPTGLGRIESGSDTKMPQFGIGSLERRIGDAIDMGGTRTRSVLRLGTLVMLERDGPEPYDGETWSWSPAELNRIAYVDGQGDLWVARADGRDARRLLRGDFTLPAWSDDGRAIAIAERKDGGRRWDISVVHLPEALRRVR
ncbi:MAG TPA: hypothetical protein VD833_04765 [Vicinamibacterales bacterium]|nr:hypothetical protein [Vicinamibacterales bacterium]